MCPRVSRISDDRRTASLKSLVTEVNAARNRLPKLWPSRPDPFTKRCWNRRESRASSSERATMQLRISPGGSMLSSLRRRPLEPPSSLTVTTAHNSLISGWFGLPSALARVTYFLSPLSRVDRPVPPPMATTRKLRVDDGLPRDEREERRWESGTATASHCPQGSLTPGRTQPLGR